LLTQRRNLNTTREVTGHSWPLKVKNGTII